RPLRPELLRARHRDETAAALRSAAVRYRFVLAELQVVARREDQILTVLILARMMLEREQRSGGDALGIGDRLRGLELAAVLIDADAGVLFAIRLLHVVAWIVVDLVVARRVRPRQHLPRLQLDARPLEIVVVVHVDARLNLAAEVPAR